MTRAALLLLALLALVLLARRREPEAVARTDWHDGQVLCGCWRCMGTPPDGTIHGTTGYVGADAEGDALEPDPYLAGLLAVPDLERMGLLYWHQNRDGRVQPVIQPLPERKP